MRLYLLNLSWLIWERLRSVQRPVNPPILGVVHMLADGDLQRGNCGVELFRVSGQ